MAGKPSSGLFAITSRWFLDYCVYLLWKEFKQKRAFSTCWLDTVQGNPERYMCVFNVNTMVRYHGERISSNSLTITIHTLLVRIIGCVS